MYACIVSSLGRLPGWVAGITVGLRVCHVEAAVGDAVQLNLPWSALQCEGLLLLEGLEIEKCSLRRKVLLSFFTCSSQMLF